jgi:hypothetical protein
VVNFCCGTHAPDKVEMVELVERVVAEQVFGLDVRNYVIVDVSRVSQPVVVAVVQIDRCTDLAQVIDGRNRLKKLKLLGFHPLSCGAKSKVFSGQNVGWGLT